MAAESKETFDYFPPAKKLKAGLRKYFKLPVEICENHDAVLYPIHRAIASKHLPFQGITLVHFDSHPDLTIPAKMAADLVFDTDRLSEAISIADWILPAVYAGHINRVVWVKPDWADQIEGEAKRFYIGKHKETGYLRVTCHDDYFLEELLYAQLEELEDVKELELKMFTLNSSSNLTKTTKDTLNKNMADSEETINARSSNIERQKLLNTEEGLFKDLEFAADNVNPYFSKCVQPLVSLVSSLLTDNQPYILDIDMDFFSTKNPFKELFTEEEFQCLADVYKFKPPLTKSEEDLNKCIVERSCQLEVIESTLKHAEELEKIPNTTNESKSNLNHQLLQLIQDIRSGSSDGEKPNFELIHSAGMTIDLPQHISTKQEIDNLLNMVYATMMSLPKPTLVTMARSTYDEYTPPDQIDYIQNSLIRILGLIYGQDFIDVHLDY